MRVDRRLILLFFDFSAMEPEQIDRSVEAAKKFVGTKMQPADLIALVSLDHEHACGPGFHGRQAQVNWLR